MASTGTLSLVNSQSARDPEVQVQARPVDSKFPSNCDPSFQNAQELARPTWTAVTLSHEASRSQQESHEASHPTIDTSHLDATDFNTSNHRHGLPSSRSSSSLASSFNTVIHLSSSTIANATPTPQVAQGSFLESRSDSSQLLTELAAKSTHENSSDSKPDDIDNANLADGKAAKIQFHNVVRISGGITSSPKRKRESKQVKQVPKKITIHRHRPPSIAEHTSSTSRSPTGRSSFGNGSPSYPHRMTSPNRASTPDSRSTLSGEIRRFDTEIPPHHLLVNLSKPTDRDSLDSELQHPSSARRPKEFARVRERRQVAQRDAERAKGGWKAWWNNWYYQSDSLTARKGKGKQDSTSATDENNDQGHSHYHSHSLDNSDSDDGSCYHDNARSESSTHQSKRKRPNPEKADSKASQSWLSWASSIIVGLPPSPAHPLLPPPPGSGILRRPRLTTTSILPGKPILPNNSRTPLLARPPLVSSYGNLPPEPPSSSDPFQSSSSRIKTPTDARFGLAPRRWFTVRLVDLEGSNDLSDFLKEQQPLPFDPTHPPSRSLNPIGKKNSNDQHIGLPASLLQLENESFAFRYIHE
ncbi:hypothetical protein PGT21_000643 [Puccinia graminis f. sp. tritici]|uniref:Uncharacterized protein n=1 Tax=Puccinia graminis f. sp. tritici TaxID=56615 RepID=A0A5B0QRB0_PUCGR|nr:hypothetical protein PGT21_000643 [Puccinia graminis f. sp. tritici]